MDEEGSRPKTRSLSKKKPRKENGTSETQTSSQKPRKKDKVVKNKLKAPLKRDPDLAYITQKLKKFKISEPVKKVTKRDLASITRKLNNLVIAEETSNKYKMKLRSYSGLAEKSGKIKIEQEIKTERDSKPREAKSQKKKPSKVSKYGSHSMTLRPRRQK